jgi:hypothetical protein
MVSEFMSLLMVQYMVVWPHAFGQDIVIMGWCVRGGSSPHGEQDTEGPKTRHSLQGHASSSLLPSGGTTS